MKKRVCLRCGNEVTKSEVDGYSYSCDCCNEDLYTFETELKDITE
jgi:hypothetical protein